MAFTLSPLVGLHGLVPPRLHLGRGDILDLAGNLPRIAEGIGKRCGAMPVELVPERAHDSCACLDRACESGVGVGDEQMQLHRNSRRRWPGSGPRSRDTRRRA